MDEYLIQKETLTEIADEVRQISGATGTLAPTGMKTELASANTEIGTQADLIAQILALLETKAAQTFETWVFTLEDGSTVEKEVALG